MKNTLKKNQDVYLIGEKLPMKVMARSERFAILSRPLDKKEDSDLLAFEVKRGSYCTRQEAYENLKDNPVYSIIDFKNECRGTDNWVLGIYDYGSEEECEKAIKDLESDSAMEISHRNKVEINIDLDRTVVDEAFAQTCESCDFYYNIETMNQDDDSNWFCPDCWKELAPVMKTDYDELKAKGEID